MPARIRKNSNGGATNPRNFPKGVKGSKTANATTRREQIVSQGLAAFRGFLCADYEDDKYLGCQ